MEALTLEPKTEERLLVYENSMETERLTSEARSRCDMLNAIAKHGLSLEEIIDATKSSSAIDDAIFRRQLKINKVVAQQFNAGKKQQFLLNEFTLPEDLEQLKYSLLAWHNYNGTRNKLEFIIDEKGHFEVDHQALERNFLQRGTKVNLEGEGLYLWQKAEELIALLKLFKVEWNHISNVPSLAKFIDANGQRIIPRWQYFKAR